jgi:N-dimethylarginine dimethylaminohydrolase
MCPPVHFDVVYQINPWMDPEHAAVDRGLACEQWQLLRSAYERTGHRVETVAPGSGLPDMVFAANSALVLDGVAFLARFRFGERRGEEQLYERWFRSHGFAVLHGQHVHEGEGDFALAGDTILAGTGFRTDVEAHREVERVFNREVVTLELVDPRYYHLDTALFVLSGDEIAYYPAAFSDASRAVLEARYPDAIIATDTDAAAFGCNSASDGQYVFMPAGAEELAAQVTARGYQVVPLDLSELRKAGGSVKCCTLELRGTA